MFAWKLIHGESSAREVWSDSCGVVPLTGDCEHEGSDDGGLEQRREQLLPVG